MPDLANLTPAGVTIPDGELHDAVVIDSAAAPGQLVRCSRPGFDLSLADDPMPWMPYVTGAGVFYPKAGDRAVIGIPDSGSPVILAWWPSAAEPDVSF